MVIYKCYRFFLGRCSSAEISILKQSIIMLMNLCQKSTWCYSKSTSKGVIVIPNFDLKFNCISNKVDFMNVHKI
jgi:hypothetical protein